MEGKLRPVLILTVGFVLLILFPAVCLGATYYLDAVNGDDSNPGTSDLPWKTIARAQNYKTGYIPSGYDPMVQSGDTVIIRNGNYGKFRESTNDNPVSKYHFHRTDWITYKAVSGHTPTFSSITINNADHSSSPLYQPGESYLWFEGFRILEGASFQYTSYVHIRNCDITSKAEIYGGLYAPYYPANSAAISTTGANYITIQDCNIHNCNDGITPSGEYWTIKNNVIHRYGDDGIHVTPKHCVIEGNHIFDCNAYRSSVEIYGSSITGTFIVGETVMQGTAAQGIFRSVWGSSNNAIDVYQTTATHFIADGGTVTGQTSGAILSGITKVDPQHTDGIQSHSSNTSDMVITNNIIHSGMWNGIKLATYNEGVISNITIANNLVYDTDYAMYMGAEPLSTAVATFTNVNIYNNTFYSRTLGVRNSVRIENLYNNIITELMITSDHKIGEIINHGNNIFREGSPTGFMNSTELLNAIPGFVDAANGNFQLTATSVARDFGDPAHASATDILGNTRDAKPDAGCYEYVILQKPDKPKPEEKYKTELKCYNNVFNPIEGEKALLWLELKDRARVKLDIYDMRGERIREVADEVRESGICKYYWYGRDDSENIVGSGVYFVHIEAGDYRKTKKIVVVK